MPARPVPPSRLCTMKEFAAPALQPALRALESAALPGVLMDRAPGVWRGRHPDPRPELRQARARARFTRPLNVMRRRMVRETYRPIRKYWEWAVIMKELSDAGLLEPGRRGLGFAVGQEPLPALFAASGVQVVATDLGQSADDYNASWADTGQHAGSVDALAHPTICSDEELHRLVTFRPVDMREIPADLTGFDFCWSSCSLEHLGDLQRGLDFVEASLATLKPGGIALHTTEANQSSLTETIESGDSVIYRRSDLEALVAKLRAAGHEAAFTWEPGTEPEDLDYDRHPYEFDVHLLFEFAHVLSTSYLLVIRKAGNDA